MARLPLALAAAILAFGTVSPARAEDTYFTPKTLLADFFKSSERVTFVKLDTAAAKAELSALLGYVPPKASYAVFVARTGDKIDGYAVIDEELGQHLPITFGVKISPAGTLERMEVLVYREAYGAEIREARFRDQLTGKTIEDKLRLGDDVVAISGATISSKSMTLGVRRALALVSIVKARALDKSLGSAASPSRPVAAAP